MGNEHNHREIIFTFKVLGWIALWISGGCATLMGLYMLLCKAVPQP